MRSSFPRLPTWGWDGLGSLACHPAAARPLPTSFTKTAVISFRLYFRPRLRWVDRWRRRADPSRGQYNQWGPPRPRGNRLHCCALGSPQTQGFRVSRSPMSLLNYRRWKRMEVVGGGKSLKPHSGGASGNTRSGAPPHPAHQALSKLL